MRAAAQEEGLICDAQGLLTEAVTAKNCLTTVGHYTPMQATLGYRPALLPDAGCGEAHWDDTQDD
eukprot:12881928-Prorocentrum_lima.AAC.1